VLPPTLKKVPPPLVTETPLIGQGKSQGRWSSSWAGGDSNRVEGNGTYKKQKSLPVMLVSV